MSGRSHRRLRALTPGALALTATTAILVSGAPAGAAQTTGLVAVVVQERSGTPGAELAVERLGGSVSRRFSSIDGFAAQVPADRVAALRAAPGVRAVTRDAPLTLTSTLPGAPLGSAIPTGGTAADDGGGSGTNGTGVASVADLTGAPAFWDAGSIGTKIGVALLDSGTVPVDGLRRRGKVQVGPDLSLESQAPHRLHRDTFGHGTHMAGIIAGHDDAAPAAPTSTSRDGFLGVAPGAQIVSVKVADAFGATDVSQVIAGIDWVVAHRDELNIKVLNLSFGTDSVQPYEIDPLAHAAESAWREGGLVVVVAAGNRGSTADRLDDPAHDPTLLAVGAADLGDVTDPADDTVADFSSRGSSTRRPDLVAPGRSVVSLRSPGSSLDAAFPGARVGSRFFRGSGTSQAAAAVSGAAALVLSHWPDLSPDQVKDLLTRTARPLSSSDALGAGTGLLDLRAALLVGRPSELVEQRHPASTGLGSLDLARGSWRAVDAGVVLDGERDIFGVPFVSHKWAAEATAGTSWRRGEWNRTQWTTWPDWEERPNWTASRWSGGSWADIDWTAMTWSSNRWSGEGWASNRWSSNRWSSNRWSWSSWGG